MLPKPEPNIKPEFKRQLGSRVKLALPAKEAKLIIHCKRLKNQLGWIQFYIAIKNRLWSADYLHFNIEENLCKSKIKLENDNSANNNHTLQTYKTAFSGKA